MSKCNDASIFVEASAPFREAFVCCCHGKEIRSASPNLAQKLAKKYGIPFDTKKSNRVICNDCKAIHEILSNDNIDHI